MSRHAKGYEEARAMAAELARATGQDIGIERDALYGGYAFRILPRPENRYGCDRTCEVVRAEEQS